MTTNSILNFLCCIPVILLFLYFIPFIGICLILTRFIRKTHTILSTNILLLILGFVILIPNVLNTFLHNLDSIVTAPIYLGLLPFSKFLISLSIILIIISFLCNHIFNKCINLIKHHFLLKSNIEQKISKENDLEIKLKQERAKNTHVVYCPHCGAANILTEDVGICEFCRSPIGNDV